MTFVETVNERTNSYLWKYFRLNDGSEVHSLYKADFFIDKAMSDHNLLCDIKPRKILSATYSVIEVFKIY